MTKQNNIRFVNPIAQNLFLLAQNPNFLADVQKLKRKHSEELRTAKSAKSIILNEFGSKSLSDDMFSVFCKTPLYATPEFLLVKTLMVFLLKNVNVNVLFASIEKNEDYKTLTAPPGLEAKADIEGVEIKMRFSFYNNKTDILKFLKKNWHIVEKAKSKVEKNRLSIQKAQPFTNFERDWNIFLDKSSGLSYSKLDQKYLLEPNYSKKVVRKIRQRINLLYSN